MEPDDELDDDGRVAGWIHPDDRLWRHPSEVAETPWPMGAQPRRLRWRWGREPKLWSVAMLAGVIGALLATGVISATGAFRHDSTTVVRPMEQVVVPASNVGTLASATVGGDDDPVVRIAERLRPAIVEIQTDGNKGAASGSGVLFRDDGYVITNNHVIDGAATIVVVLANGRQLKGTKVGGDADTDIAVVKVDGSGNLPIATLGTAKDLKVGQEAIAIGSPLGLVGGPSVSKGVVSALGRQVTTKNGGPALLDMIQIAAPIAPGSSGGALVDRSGAVIGITTALAVTDVGAEGVGFATPIDIARDTAEQLIATGHAIHVWIGVEGEDVDSATATQLSVDGGAMVKNVRTSSPAAAGGLQPQDVIVAIDSRTVTSMSDLVVALRSRKPGDTVTIGFLRDGRPGVAKVTLAERPKNL